MKKRVNRFATKTLTKITKNGVEMKLLEIAQQFDAPSYKTLLEFNGKIVILGFGSVGQAILPLILKHFRIAQSNVTVLEKDDNSALFSERYGNTDISYFPRIEITRKNLHETLSSLLSPGDFLINVSLNIDGVEIVKWCLEHDIMHPINRFHINIFNILQI